MTSYPPMAPARARTLPFGVMGTLLIALAVYASAGRQQWLVAGVAGAAGLALWRRAALAPSRSSWSEIAIDALAFAIFAYQRNDYLAFWQLVGPWADVPRFNFAGA